jgi:serine protease Do
VDCKQFDGQVVRLERFKDIADKFVRVRLTRIDNLDLSLFEFDYDLTMMIFFLNAEEKVYARYGGRDARNADARQSLDGLRYTMQSVLAMHERSAKEFAPRTPDAPKSARPGGFGKGGGKGCMHCHQVRERLNEQLKRTGQWEREMFWRYPMPDTLGIELDVQRSNVAKRIKDASPAASIGLKPGDLIKRLNGVPIHSFGDAQFALEHAPKSGAIDIAWQRGKEAHTGKLALAEGWRKADVSWRPSIQWFVPNIRISGADLDADERKKLGLTEKQLAFRQRDAISQQARDAGIRPGDIILGVDEKKLDLDMVGFQYYIQRNYFEGDRVTVNLLREGTALKIPVKLLR